MKENVQMAIWVAVATAAGVLLAKVISNTGIIEKFVPYEGYECYDRNKLF